MRRTRQSGAFANPVLVGAVTVLAVLVAVFLAYNANQGLPFVPTKQLKVQFLDGSNLVVGNDVREGGFRVGVVSELGAIELPNGQVGAQATLKLDQAHSDVPVDSTATIRPRSVLGLKYVDIQRGSSRQVIGDGGTLAISHTDVPVQFDDINKIFDAKTRIASRQAISGVGDTLTGRGSALNDTIASLPELFAHLQPVAQYLSDPSAELTRFLDTADTLVGTIAPVAKVNARLFTDMATAFEAISRDPRALQSTIAESPSTLDTGTASLQAQRPFLTDFTTLSHALTPATAELHAALPDINPAIEAGTRTLIRTPPLNARLQDFMRALQNLSLAPGTNVAINALTSTVSTLGPMVRYLGPYVTVCNYWNYWWTFLSEHISEATSFGFAQRALLNFANHQPNNVGQQGATQPANGYAPLPDQSDAEYLHGPAYGAAIDNQGNADCETGQRGYPLMLNSLDPLKRKLDTDQHTPGNQGPTWTGRAHVPAGETFSRNPLTGPQTPAGPPSNP